MRTRLAQFAAAAGLAAVITSHSFAQSEPTEPLDPAVKQAHDRLPDDQPKGTAASGTKNAASTTTATAPTTGEPSEADMMQMMAEMGKVNENHKLLEQLVGDWTYTVKMWMAPEMPPSESKGTASRKAEMGGRYFIANATGKFQMPGPDGKMQEVDFKGMSVDGYDNAKKKFVSSWIDSMGTGILLSEGTYDPSTKTFAYVGNYDMAPGVTSKVRETVTLEDKDHYTMAMWEHRGGEDAKTMEIAYTRKK
ncbi:MAG: DUF1579 domain-containing protein [Chthoniobacterales bacterium]